MRSRVPSTLRWTKQKTLDEILEDPVLEEAYGLFLRVKDSPRHIAFKPETLFNEVLAICTRMYEDKMPAEHLEHYAHDIYLDMGWHYAVDLVMTMAYALIKLQPKNPPSIQELLISIESQYQHNSYWAAFLQMNKRQAPVRKRKPLQMIPPDDIRAVVGQLNQQLAKVNGSSAGPIVFNLSISNEIKGPIDRLRVDKAEIYVESPGNNIAKQIISTSK